MRYISWLNVDIHENFMINSMKDSDDLKLEECQLSLQIEDKKPYVFISCVGFQNILFSIFYTTIFFF